MAESREDEDDKTADNEHPTVDKTAAVGRNHDDVFPFFSMNIVPMKTVPVWKKPPDVFIEKVCLK